jgi:hypothetical protein
MQPRLADPRVGWFTMDQIMGSDELKSDSKTFIRRWRLEPKAYRLCKRGTCRTNRLFITWILPPEKLRKYIKQGLKIGKAFETAGFKMQL